jgi:hypothetical protein
MKKNLLTIFSLLSVLTLSAQDTWVTGSAPVRVLGSTMFYHGGDFNVKLGASAVVTNDGFVYVKNKNYINNQGDAASFYIDVHQRNDLWSVNYQSRNAKHR